MKTLRQTAVALLCAIIPATAAAQENLKKAIDGFVGNGKTAPFIKVGTYVDNPDGAAKPASYCHTYSFKMPAEGRKKFNEVLAAFNKDMTAAYNVRTKDAGIDDYSMASIPYGHKLDVRIEFGTHIDRNYRMMCVRDVQDSLKRYFYGIAWLDNAPADSLDGSITVIYGPDPRSRRTISSNLVMSDNGGYIITRRDDGNDISLNFDALSSPSFPFNDRDEQTGIGNWADTVDTDTVRTGMDFIRKFGILHSAYISETRHKGGNSGTVRTALANKVVELCKEHGSLLNATEKDTCAEGIAEMQRRTDDKFLKGLFNIAIDALKE